MGQMRGMRSELEQMKSETDLALQEKEAGIEEFAEKESQVQKEKDCKRPTFISYRAKLLMHIIIMAALMKSKLRSVPIYCEFYYLM